MEAKEPLILPVIKSGRHSYAAALQALAQHSKSPPVPPPPPPPPPAFAPPAKVPWTPRDDLTLKDAVISTGGDFEKIASTATFSQVFAKQDIQDRWNALLYDPEIAAPSAAAMAALPPMAARREQGPKKRVTVPKSRLLGPALSQVVNEDQAKLVSAKSTAALVAAATTTTTKKSVDARRKEYKAVTTSQKKSVMRLEKEIEKERERQREADGKTLAILRGRKVRHAMRTKEIVIGRATSDVPVDVNVTDEGGAGPSTRKVSRRQALIKFKTNGGAFSISNIGRRTVYVNGQPVRTLEKRRLEDGCLIEMCDVRFIFEINKALVNKITRLL